MKSKGVNPTYSTADLITEVILLSYFGRLYPVLPRCCHARCVDVFVEDENACEAVLAVYASNLRVTGLAVLAEVGVVI